MQSRPKKLQKIDAPALQLPHSLAKKSSHFSPIENEEVLQPLFMHDGGLFFTEKDFYALEIASKTIGRYLLKNIWPLKLRREFGLDLKLVDQYAAKEKAQQYKNLYNRLSHIRDNHLLYLRELKYLVIDRRLSFIPLYATQLDDKLTTHLKIFYIVQAARLGNTSFVMDALAKEKFSSHVLLSVLNGFAAFGEFQSVITLMTDYKVVPNETTLNNAINAGHFALFEYLHPFVSNKVGSLRYHNNNFTNDTKAFLENKIVSLQIILPHILLSGQYQLLASLQKFINKPLKTELKHQGYAIGLSGNSNLLENLVKHHDYVPDACTLQGAAESRNLQFYTWVKQQFDIRPTSICAFSINELGQQDLAATLLNQEYKDDFSYTSNISIEPLYEISFYVVPQIRNFLNFTLSTLTKLFNYGHFELALQILSSAIFTKLLSKNIYWQHSREPAEIEATQTQNRKRMLEDIFKFAILKMIEYQDSQQLMNLFRLMENAVFEILQPGDLNQKILLSLVEEEQYELIKWYVFELPDADIGCKFKLNTDSIIQMLFHRQRPYQFRDINSPTLEFLAWLLKNDPAILSLHTDSQQTDAGKQHIRLVRKTGLLMRLAKTALEQDNLSEIQWLQKNYARASVQKFMSSCIKTGKGSETTYHWLIAKIKVSKEILHWIIANKGIREFEYFLHQSPDVKQFLKKGDLLKTALKKNNMDVADSILANVPALKNNHDLAKTLLDLTAWVGPPTNVTWCVQNFKAEADNKTLYNLLKTNQVTASNKTKILKILLSSQSTHQYNIESLNAVLKENDTGNFFHLAPLLKYWALKILPTTLRINFNEDTANIAKKLRRNANAVQFIEEQTTQINNTSNSVSVSPGHSFRLFNNKNTCLNETKTTDESLEKTLDLKWQLLVHLQTTTAEQCKRGFSLLDNKQYWDLIVLLPASIPTNDDFANLLEKVISAFNANLRRKKSSATALELQANRDFIEILETLSNQLSLLSSPDIKKSSWSHRSP